MIWLSLPALLACLFAAGVLGYRVAATALAAPSRLSRAALGSGIGLVALGLPLLWLPRVLPVGGALLLAGGLCALGAVALRRLSAPKPRPDGRLAVAGVAVLSVLVYLSALAFWAEGTVGRADVGTMYLHSGLVAGIARGNFPVVNPFEPDFDLQYRVTLHTLGAGAVDLLDVLTPSVMPHLVASVAVVLVLTLYGALAGRLSSAWALGGAAVAYAWGPLYWSVTPPAIRERGLGDVLGVIVEAPDTIAWSGVLLGGPFYHADPQPDGATRPDSGRRCDRGSDPWQAGALAARLDGRGRGACLPGCQQRVPAIHGTRGAGTLVLGAAAASPPAGVGQLARAGGGNRSGFAAGPDHQWGPGRHVWRRRGPGSVATGPKHVPSGPVAELGVQQLQTVGRVGRARYARCSDLERGVSG